MPPVKMTTVPSEPSTCHTESPEVDAVLAAGTADQRPVNAVHGEIDNAPRPSASWFSRVPTTWKALTLIAAIFVSGVALAGYTKKFATHDDVTQQALRSTELQNQIRVLRDSDVGQTADIASIKNDTTAIREDVRTLLQVMLGRPVPKSKKP